MPLSVSRPSSRITVIAERATPRGVHRCAVGTAIAATSTINETIVEIIVAWDSPRSSMMVSAPLLTGAVA